MEHLRIIDYTKTFGGNYKLLPRLRNALGTNFTEIYAMGFYVIKETDSNTLGIPTRMHAIDSTESGKLLADITFYYGSGMGVITHDILTIILLRLQSMYNATPSKDLDTVIEKIESALGHSTKTDTNRVDVTDILDNGVYSKFRVTNKRSSQEVASISIQVGSFINNTNGISLEDLICMLLNNRLALDAGTPTRRTKKVMFFLEEALLWLYKGRTTGSIVPH